MCLSCCICNTLVMQPLVEAMLLPESHYSLMAGQLSWAFMVFTLFTGGGVGWRAPVLLHPLQNNLHKNMSTPCVFDRRYKQWVKYLPHFWRSYRPTYELVFLATVQCARVSVFIGRKDEDTYLLTVCRPGIRVLVTSLLALVTGTCISVYSWATQRGQDWLLGLMMKLETETFPGGPV